MTAINWHWKSGADLPDSQESVRLSMWAVTMSQFQSRTSKPNDAHLLKHVFLEIIKYVECFTKCVQQPVKKNEITSFAATLMDLEIIPLSEVSQTQVTSYIPYLWNPENDTDELIYKTEKDSDIENKLTVTKGERREA